MGRQLRLSPRELELVQEIFDSKKLTAIAKELGLSLGTIKTYSQRLYRKLQVNDQRELTLVVFGAYLNLLTSRARSEPRSGSVGPRHAELAPRAPRRGAGARDSQP